MIRITITEPAEDAEELADRLRYIAGLLEQGFTSGYDPGWSLDEEAG